MFNKCLEHFRGNKQNNLLNFKSKNPTIFFIVDRLELEEQLYKELYSLDIVEPEIIGSIRELKEVLSYDDYRGKRGVFITLIHKFRPEELRDLQKDFSTIKGLYQSQKLPNNHS